MKRAEVRLGEVRLGEVRLGSFTCISHTLRGSIFLYIEHFIYILIGDPR